MQLTIWLEIHIKIKSPNKLFCQCKNEQNFDTLLPNTNICPVCTGQPWAIPTLSYEPLFQALLVGKILNCKIQKTSSFDRKSYFYPDLPMGYQITQLYQPTNINWKVSFFTDNNYSQEKTIGIRDAHIENDTAKMIHNQGQALIDFNRAGTPLVEIVTNPDFEDPNEVSEFLKELQRRIKYNNISDADMDKWQMRIDVNISLRKDKDAPYWTRVELKNINSFWMVRRAINNEKERQLKIIHTGWKIEQETRRRNDQEWKSYSMRSKENALDYRYFPEPDLPPLILTDKILKKVEDTEIEIPHKIIKKFKKTFWFHKEYINAIISDKKTLDFFLDTLKKCSKGTEKIIAKRIAWPISAYQKENYKNITELNFSQKQFIEFIEITKEWKILDNKLKKIINQMLQSWGNAKDIIKKEGFDISAFSETKLEEIILKIIQNNTSIVQQYKDGKTSVIWFFVGQVMKETQWKANPKIIQKKIKQLLN